MSSEAEARPGRSVGGVLPYVLAVAMAVVLVVVTLARGGPSDAAKDTLGGKQLKIMAPADPGGGWDSTGRAMQAALEDIVGRSEVYNVTGAGGTIGLSQFVNYDGQSNQLMVMGLVMVGAIAANEPKVKLDRVTPIAELVNEEQLIVVPKDSPIQDVGDLEAAMRKDIDKVAWAGGSAGGAEQILAGLIAKDLGEEPADVNYIAHSGGGEAIATLLSRKDTVGVSSVSEFRPQIEAGKLRPIAVASAKRIDQMKDTQTLKESGIDVEVTNWRGVVAPPGITADQRKGLEDIILRMTRSASWKETLEREGWKSVVLVGDDFDKFLTAEIKRVTGVVKELGIGKVE
jgi:putative tricarboxylic transport membrane protein